MPINNHLSTLFMLGTLSVNLDLDVKLCGHVSLGTEELCFAEVLVYTVTLGVRYFPCKRQLWVKGCLT